MKHLLNGWSNSGAARTALLIVTAVVAVVLTGTASAQNTFRCESTDGARHECRFEGFGRIQVAQQFSHDACVEGQSWGVDGHTIWVDRGCRASFTLDPRSTQNGGSLNTEQGRGNQNGGWNAQQGRGNQNGGWNAQQGRGIEDRQRANRTITVVCESRDGRRHRCAADTLGQITLSRQLTTRSRCVQGRTWGSDSNGIWVDRGCRAEFLIADNGGTYRDRGRSQAMRTLVCESTNSRRTYCRTDAQFGVQLTREMSGDRCVFNRTWGSDANGVWVSNGCRAEFAVNTRDRQ